MTKVILITGASSGIGRETAKLFQTKNWRVAATMRAPEKAEDLQHIADVETFRLDVTDTDSSKQAIADVLEKFGRIDAVVNNAGYGLVGAFEAATPEQIERQYQTNVFGLMNVTREILPYFRAEKRGVIANVASVGGRMTFPLYSLYNSTKWAVEGFSEALQFELEQFNIRVKIIEPGPIKTDFYDRSEEVTRKEGLTAYDWFIDRALPNMKKAGAAAPGGALVAETIYSAVTDGTKKLRYGVNSKNILLARKLLPDWAFFRLIKGAILK
ncbi:MAG TPA: SDR family oxidoreductase [Pyrinomonadaceae bacterium]|jgi:NAD(P)-dependent dehydrogenase (short-subunit alcohol dehydrogenase family)